MLLSQFMTYGYYGALFILYKKRHHGCVPSIGHFMMPFFTLCVLFIFFLTDMILIM